MSHFTVMVISDDHDARLAPYHEFECTGCNDEYVQDIDITDEINVLFAKAQADGEEDPLAEALGYHGLEDAIVESEDVVDRDGDHKFGYAVVVDGNLVKAVNRTNPNKKWDWYQVGGRWTGFLKLKPGATGKSGRPGLMTDAAEPGYADIARKGDVDWNGMRRSAEINAGKKWDEVRAISPDGWESWDSVRSRIADIDDARKFYHGQAGKAALRDAGDRSMLWIGDDILATREDYVRDAGLDACVPFALIKDGKWIERGQMGWFGMSIDRVDHSDWSIEINAMIDDLPDDTLITIVDCHI